MAGATLLRHGRRRRLATVVALVALLGTTGALAESALAMKSGYGPVLARSTSDRSDDVRRKPQVHVMYVLPSDGLDRALDTNGTLRNTVSSFQNWLAEKTTGKKALQIDTFSGSLDVTFFRLSRTDEEIASFGPFVRDLIEAELTSAGFTAENKLYAVYYDGTSTFACGGAAWPPTFPGSVAALYLLGLPQGPVPCSSQVFAGPGGSPTYLEFAMLHEIIHTLGFVATCAPNQWRTGHVSDDPNDLMWAGDGPWVPSGWANVVLDSGNDDYYRAHVHGCLDLARSSFLAPF
jgi:hypothetical protein